MVTALAIFLGLCIALAAVGLLCMGTFLWVLVATLMDLRR